MYTLVRSSLLNNSRISLAALRPTTFSFLPSRSILTLSDHKYTAHATAKGAGRNGEVKSGSLGLKLATPKELGGNGKGENPEQLFAMGYASCLLGAIQLQAKRLEKADMGKNAVVHTKVHIGSPVSEEGFGLAVDIEVEGVDEEVLQAGHAFCPYSRALKYGAQVNVKTAPRKN